MVKRLVSLFLKEFKDMHFAALILGISTLASQILALVRDRIFATQIGPGEVLDIYYTSFRIPDLLFITIASLASVTVLAPYLTKILHDEWSDSTHTKARMFLGGVAKAFSLLILVTTIIVFVLMPHLTKLIAPGFSDENLRLLTHMSRLMLLSPVLLGFSNLLSSATQVFRRFFTYALSPVLYNLGIIIGAIFFYPSMGIQGLTMGVIIGAAMHLAIQIPTLKSIEMFPIFPKKTDLSEIWNIAKMSLPRTLTLALTSIGYLALTAIASVLGDGSISRMQFAYNLQSVPVAIVGLSYSVAAFPSLTDYFARGKRVEFSRALSSAFRHIILWCVPIAILFIVLRAQIVRVLLGAGKFSWDDTKLTAAAFALFTISLVFNSLLVLVIRAYYATGKTWKPLKMGLIAALVQVIRAYTLTKLFLAIPSFNYLMASILRVADVKDNEMLMLPLAFSIGSLVNFVLLWGIFKKNIMLDEDIKSIGTSLKEISVSSFFAGFVTYMMLHVLAPVFNQETFQGIFFQGLISGVLGIITLFAGLNWLQNIEFLQLKAYFKEKLSRFSKS